MLLDSITGDSNKDENKDQNRFQRDGDAALIY